MKRRVAGKKRVGSIISVLWVCLSMAACSGSSSPNQASTSKDNTPPVFAGLTSTKLSASGNVELAWSAATDNITPQSDLLYAVCYSTDSAGCTQNFILKDISTAGATSIVLTDSFLANTTYTFLVRVIDAAGNIDANADTKNVTIPAAPDTTPPTMSGGITFSNVTASAISLSWSAGTDNQTAPSNLVYEVCMSSDSSGCSSFTASFTTGAGITAYTVTGLSPGSTYYFSVRDMDEAGNNSMPLPVASKATVDIVPPSTPETPTFTNVSGTSLTVNWTASTDNTSLSQNIVYIVCQSSTLSGCANFTTASQGVTLTATIGGATSLIVYNLTPVSTYYFAVLAKDEAGNYSTPSNVASHATLDNVPPSVPSFPTLPTPTVTNMTGTSLTLSWNASTDNLTAQASIIYEVCMSTSATGCQPFSAAITSVAGATNEAITGLIPATTYYFFVRARDAAGNTSPAAETTPVTTNDTIPPSAPGTPTFATVTGTSIVVSWAASTDNSTTQPQLVYQICYAQTQTGCNTFTPQITTPAVLTGMTSTTITGLTQATTYYFAVRAEDVAGNYSTSSIVTSTMTADITPPSTPAPLTAMSSPPIMPTTLDLTWTASTDNVTPSAEIVYDICQTQNNACNPFVTTYTTAVGATTYTVTGLTPNTPYTFVVRARDQAGNPSDISTLSVTTAPVLHIQIEPNAYAAGYAHTLVISNDGTLYSWGDDQYSQLGDGATGYQKNPIKVMAGVEAVAAGYNHSLVLKTDYTLWSFGLNSFGQLGDGTTNNRSTPVQVLTNVVSVAAGGNHTLALKADGTLWVFGDNSSGQLGDGSTSAYVAQPEMVATGVVAIATGSGHSLMIKSVNGSNMPPGTLWAFGDNSRGQLGDGSVTSEATPENISAIPSSFVTNNVVKVSCGGLHSLVLDSGNNLWAFGDNTYNQLGSASPPAYVMLPTVAAVASVSTMAAGENHTIVVKQDGTVVTFGSNGSGQLGNGATTQPTPPQTTPTGTNIANIVNVAAGGQHTIVYRQDHTLWSFGWNQYGQLGNGSIINSSSAVQVTGITGVW